MLDYNSMSYQEGRRLLKQAFTAGDIMPALQGAWNSAKGAVGSAKDWAGQQLNDASASGMGKSVRDFASKAWADPRVKDTAIGAGIGGLVGVGSSLAQDPDERSPVSRGLTGLVLGGLGGLGYATATGAKTPDEIKHDVQRTTDAASAKHTMAENAAVGAADPGQALTPLQQARKAFTRYDDAGNPIGTDVGGGLGATAWDAYGATPAKMMGDIAKGDAPSLHDVGLVGAQGVGAGAGYALGGKPLQSGVERLLHGRAMTPQEALTRNAGKAGLGIADPAKGTFPTGSFAPGSPNRTAFGGAKDELQSINRQMRAHNPAGPAELTDEGALGALFQHGGPDAIRLAKEEAAAAVPGLPRLQLTDPAKALDFKGLDRDTLASLNRTDKGVARVGRWYDRASTGAGEAPHLGGIARGLGRFGGAAVGAAAPWLADRAATQLFGGSTGIADEAQRQLQAQLASGAQGQ